MPKYFSEEEEMDDILQMINNKEVKVYMTQKENTEWKQQKNPLFVVGKVDRKCEGHDQILNQITKHGGQSECHNSTKSSGTNQTELRG